MNKIYKIEFGDYIYYGSTKQKKISQRQSRHNYNLRHNPKQPLYKQAKESGVEKLICEVICECNDEERFILENTFIRECPKICLNDRCANLTPEEQIQRRVESRRKYVKTEKGKLTKARADKKYRNNLKNKT